MKIGLTLLATFLFIQEPSPAPSATGVIRGTVVNAITGTPLQGAVLRVAPGREALASITSTTGSDGRFELTGLPDDQYELAPTVQGFAYGGSNRGSIPSRGRIVTVTNGRRVENIRIGLLPAVTISGKLLDENGMPAARKSIGLSQKGYQTDGSPGLTANTTARPGLTDSNGDYRIQNVLPGEYYIVSSLEDSTVYYPGVRRVEQAVSVVVSNTDIVGLDFPLLPAAKYSVRLRVSGVTPTPDDITFRLRRRSPSVDLAGKYTTLPIPADGTFKLTDLLPASYYLTVQWYEKQPEGAPVNPIARVGQSFPFDDGYLVSAIYNGVDVLGREFTVDGSKDGRLDIVLDAKAGSIDGVVRDAKGDPFGDATIVLLPPIGRRDGLEFSSLATSDQDGKFSFTGVAPGNYSLFAWEFAPQNAYRNADWLRPYEQQATRITIGKGEVMSVNVRVIPRGR